MTTAATIVDQALRRIRVVASGETGDANDTAYCLTALNELLNQWSATRSMSPAQITEQKTLTPSTASYTLGPTGTLTFTYRPIKISSAFIRIGTTDYSLQEWTQGNYNAVADKSSTGTPYAFLYVPSVLLGRLYLYPAPDTASTLSLTYDAALAAFSTLSTDIDLAPAYQSALVLSLAEYVAESFNVSLTPSLVAQAANARRVLKRMNSRIPDLNVCEVGNSGDIETDS